MLPQSDNTDPDTDWKQQYQQVLRDLDSREQEWGQEKQKLLRSLLSLTFLFQDDNELLDKKLYDLKEKLRQTGKQLPQQQIDDTVSAVVKAKKNIDADRSRTSQLVQHIVDLLSADKRFERYTAPLDAVRDELQNTDISPVSKLKQVNQVLTEINKKLGQEKQKPDTFKVFLNRLAAHEKTDKRLVELCRHVINLNDEKALLQSINDCIEQINIEPGHTNNTDQPAAAVDAGIAHVLTMLDWITIPGKSQKKLDNLKTQLEERKESKELGSLLRRLSITVSNAFMDLQSELSETEGFLKRVTNQLDEITLQIADIQKLENESFTDSESLNVEMEKQIRLIREGVDETDSIDRIKETINKRIEILQDNMDQFIRVEQTRKITTDQHHRELVERLGNMEKETESLRQSIEEEKNKALKDALTGIPNRMAFDDRINAEYKRWRRHQSNLSLCLIDIDKFKSVNDTYGHKAGDIVLRTVAEKSASRIRASDFFCRYGGEEFALVLPETGIDAAIQLADSLRETIEKCTFQYGQKTVPITISCGLAQFKGKDTIDSAFNRADKALYMAKDKGRNCCVSEHELPLLRSVENNKQ